MSFAGTWSGTYTITACGHTEDFKGADFCGTFTKGSVLPMTLALTQTGSSVTGTLSQGTLVTSVSGSVTGDGHLILTGSTTNSGFTIETLGWNTELAGTTMTGGWATKFTHPSASGFAQIANTLNVVTKSSAAGPSASSVEPDQTNGTLQDLFDRMKE